MKSKEEIQKQFAELLQKPETKEVGMDACNALTLGVIADGIIDIRDQLKRIGDLIKIKEVLK